MGKEMMETNETTKEDIIDFLDTPDDKGEEEILDLGGEEKSKETEEVEEVKEEKEEEDELEEIEKEIKPPSEEDLELMIPVRRREILAKYPHLFKDFPYLERAYYREQKFTEFFPTIEDAEKASENTKIMERFEEEIMHGGNIGIVLDSIKEEDPESFNNVVDNLLPALHKTDQGAYHHVLGNVIKGTIISMVQEANNLGDEVGGQLRAAAQLLNQFVFGNSQFQPPTKLAPKKEENSKEEQLKQREQQMLQSQFESARDDLQDKVDNTIRGTIDNNIDPKKSMDPYVRKNASRDAFEQLGTLISQDSRLKVVLEKLWEKAFEQKFSRPSLERIRSAYLSRAKILLPTVIKKARAEALKGHGRTEGSPRKGPITPGRSTSSTSGKVTEIPKGMKSIDFLMQD